MKNATNAIKVAYPSTAKAIGFNDTLYNQHLVPVIRERLTQNTDHAFGNLLDVLNNK